MADLDMGCPFDADVRDGESGREIQCIVFPVGGVPYGFAFWKFVQTFGWYRTIGVLEEQHPRGTTRCVIVNQVGSFGQKDGEGVHGGIDVCPDDGRRIGTR